MISNSVRRRLKRARQFCNSQKTAVSLALGLGDIPIFVETRALQKLGNVRIFSPSNLRAESMTARAAMMAALAAGLTGCATHAPDTAVFLLDHGAQRMMRSRDVDFALNASQMIAGENQLAQLAIKQASAPNVKQFAGQLLAENQKMANDLQGAAAESQLKLPENPTNQMVMQDSSLENLTGGRFDTSLLRAFVVDLGEEVASYKKEADKGRNPRLKSFAGQVLPALQKRLEAAKALRAQTRSPGE
jgi:predicted outer membrane protein